MKKFIILLITFISGITIGISQCVTSGAIPIQLFGEVNGSGLTQVKVYWHIVDDGSSPSILKIEQAISTAKAKYSNYGIKLKSDCITTIHDELLTTNQIDGSERELCNFDEYCKNDGLNIFFMNDDVEFVQIAGGIATIGNNKAVIKITGNEDWITLVHEIGHCFGLFHTFSGRPYTSGAEWNCETGEGAGSNAIVGSDGVIFSQVKTKKCDGSIQAVNVNWEKVDGSNSTNSGDFVTDTPAEMSVFNSGGLTGSNRCDDYFDDCSDMDICNNILNDKQRKDQNCHKYTPDWNNYMGYRGGCRNHFTPGQVSRMKGLLQDRLDFMLYSGDIKHITQNVTFDSPQSFNKLRIAENVTVTFKDTEALFAEGGYLQMMEGSSLVLDNSTLTTCGSDQQRWIGIQCFDANSIEMKNGSTISKADIGIRLKLAPSLAGGGSAVHPRLELDNSTIKHCDIGIQFGTGQTTSVIRNNSKVNWNRIGIRSHHHSGIVIEDTDILGNYEGIYAVDSYMQIKANTDILGNYWNFLPNFYPDNRGISIDGTFPLGSGIQIGDNSGAYNRIGQTDEAGIVSNGSNHPAGVVINNCEFDNTVTGGLALLGENNFNVQNNNFKNSERGAFLWATGGSINNLNCNVFEDIDIVTNTVAFTNDNTNILENNFNGVHDLDIGLFFVEIKPQGQPTNPAANCFSDPSQSSHIISASGVSSFNYHFYNENNNPGACQEPINPIGFTPVSTDIPGDGNCFGNIGIFNVISPGGGGNTTGIDPQNDDPDAVCKSCVLDQIDKWIDEVVGVGGDDPTTTADEQTYPIHPVLPAYEEILYQWINYALYIALETNDVAYGAQVLNPLKGWHWKSKLYGLHALKGNISDAHSALNSLSENNANEVQFKQVQRINMKRFDGSSISSTEIDLVLSIATGNEPSSGYARSLYRILTDKRLPLVFPIIDRSSTPRSIHNDLVEFNIYPNPTSDLITIESSVNLNRVSVLDVNGKIMSVESINNSNTSIIDLSSYINGVYLLEIIDVNGESKTKKVIKL